MERNTGQHSAVGTDAISLTNEVKLVSIDTSGEEASSPTCPLTCWFARTSQSKLIQSCQIRF